QGQQGEVGNPGERDRCQPAERAYGRGLDVTRFAATQRQRSLQSRNERDAESRGGEGSAFSQELEIHVVRPRYGASVDGEPCRRGKRFRKSQSQRAVSVRALAEQGRIQEHRTRCPPIS